MIYLLYDIILELALLVLAPYFLLKVVWTGKYRKSMPERFGFIKKEKLKGIKDGIVVWFHAVSVGETKAALPLVKLFKERHPEMKIVFSTVTETGNDAAKKEGKASIDSLIYFPLDISWIAGRVVRKINPRLFIVVEKEFWPNVFRILKARSVPIVVVNGTISERSFRRYDRFSFFFRRIFSILSCYSAITETDAQRAISLGADAQRVSVSGNMKFDVLPPKADGKDMDAIRESLGIEENSLVIVCGSTHPPEEEIILKAYKRLKKEFKNLILILAPRHPERFDEVAGIVKNSGLSFKRRSIKEEGAKDVVILDTMGELFTVYGVSDIAFIGGTLAPIGGHNLLEPAFFGKPVIYGNYLKNYLYMAELLENQGAGIRVKEDELFGAIKKLLEDEALREEMGKKASAVISLNKGATQKAFDIIQGIMRLSDRAGRLD